jgi:hypothetical protein
MKRIIKNKRKAIKTNTLEGKSNFILRVFSISKEIF